jgi:signal transduction histidine kinase
VKKICGGERENRPLNYYRILMIQTPAPGPDSRERILVADDDPGLLLALPKILSPLGLAIDTAANVPDALLRFRASETPLALLDLAIPTPADGMRLAQEIKWKSPKTEIIFITAYPSLETALPAMRIGVCDYLIKPFSSEDLQTAVRNRLEQRRLSSELERERSLRRELQAAYRELQKVERLKEALLARISHELRSPLTPAMLALGYMERSGLPAESRPALENMKESLGRMAATVENLLLFAQMQKGGLKIKWEAADLADILSRIAQRYRPLWESRELDLELDFAPGPILAWGEASLLETAFRHLFLNAVQFNKRGGRIRVHAKAQPEFIRVALTDTGAGIPRQHLEKIFDGFYQAADYMTREVGGLGVGLAIARRIVEAHRGSVRLESEEGKGTTATVLLPGAPPNPPAP